jgi:hypothetical protein
MSETAQVVAIVSASHIILASLFLGVPVWFRSKWLGGGTGKPPKEDKK